RGDRLRPARRRIGARRRPAQRDRRERTALGEGLEAVTIRIGQAGLGEWGKNLARNFADLAEVTWLADPAEGKAAEFHTRYPHARWADSFDEMLEDPELDAVVIATPVPTHYELAKRA